MHHAPARTILVGSEVPFVVDELVRSCRRERSAVFVNVLHRSGRLALSLRIAPLHLFEQIFEHLREFRRHLVAVLPLLDVDLCGVLHHLLELLLRQRSHLAHVIVSELGAVHHLHLRLRQQL